MHGLTRWLLPAKGQKLRHAWFWTRGRWHCACSTLPTLGDEVNGRDSPTPKILSPEHCLHCGSLCSIPSSKKR